MPSHNLEHVYAHEVPTVLEEFYRVLELGGILCLQMPDLQTVEVHRVNVARVLQRVELHVLGHKASERPSRQTEGRVAHLRWRSNWACTPGTSPKAGQDRYLNEQIFKNRRNGTFVEIGGHDGWTGSNCGSRTSWAVADGTRLACSDGQAGAFSISRSRAHTHRRHGHPLQTVPSAGLRVRANITS